MKRTTLSLVILVAGLAAAVPALVWANGDSAQARPDGEHAVVKGDTLWDISGKYLNDPFMWPEVWKLNPGIKNPDLIYPGDRVRLPGGREVVVGAGEPDAAKADKPAAKAAAKEKSPFDEEPFVDISQTLLVTPKKADKKVISLDSQAKMKIPVATTGEILESGFIAEDIDEAMTIAGSPEGERSVYSTGDEVLLLAWEGIKPGDMLMTFRPAVEVEHPATGEEMGSLIKVTGLMEALGPSDGFILCRVVDIVNDVRNTDLVVPYTEPELVYDPVEKNPALRGEWGYVVAALDDKTLNAMLYIVYIDLGSDDGIKPGDIFEARRSGGVIEVKSREAAQDGGRTYLVADHDTNPVSSLMTDDMPLPDVVAGEIQVISVQAGSSTAKVISFDEPVRPGYRVYYKD